MLVIPVIDIRGGAVVRAVKGERANYRPIETPLAANADPAAVAQGLATLYPFPILYVADLDGIERGVPDLKTQAALRSVWPGPELWIDDGRTAPNSRAPGVTSIIGTEAMRDPIAIPKHAILSLDFKGDDFQGPSELLDEARLWPDRVIVMTLARVGSGEGPDLARLAAINAKAGAREIYAAGGVRDAGDLLALQRLGITGALVASALHGGQIKTGDLEEIAGEVL